MAQRISFTIDTPLAERIDIYAKKEDIDRTEALHRLLEAGLAKAETDGIIPPEKDRDYRREQMMQKNIASISGNLDELKKEIRAMHHLINMNQKTPEKKRGHFKKE
ncbi:MAG TPA: hypothetical protein O0W79_04780 [Methanocorpusculum sp.]|nr:hypothetical protein [Methanocorpusculum sp.]HJJ40159.1 hypothetical protein [Methanocorpusculum sp.]HJJ57314.1 hypothetical protein [Methanocorpusculum sp.]HJJ95869.1 hypothetical protein [Methanocorpusculum sp.]